MLPLDFQPALDAGAANIRMKISELTALCDGIFQFSTTPAALQLALFGLAATIFIDVRKRPTVLKAGYDVLLYAKIVCCDPYVDAQRVNLNRL